MVQRELIEKQLTMNDDLAQGEEGLVERGNLMIVILLAAKS